MFLSQFGTGNEALVVVLLLCPSRWSVFSHSADLKRKKNAIVRATGNPQLSVCARGAVQLCSTGTKPCVVLELQQRAERLLFPFCCMSEEKHREVLAPWFTFNPLRPSFYTSVAVTGSNPWSTETLLLDRMIQIVINLILIKYTIITLISQKCVCVDGWREGWMGG